MSEKMIELEIKVTPEELKRIGEYCRERGVNFSEWLREIALREIASEKSDKEGEEEEDFSSWVFII
ncbi:hypothetical protein [Hydrogenimonas sp.]